MFWNKYPYTDFHELNLDMILGMMRELHQDWDEFRAVNEITNAGAWDITKQYQAWTVVSDNNVGYISLKPVPAGVAITNTEYWGVIADYNILITNLTARIAALEANMAIVNKELAGRRVILIGDSWGDPSNDDDFVTWSSQLISKNPAITFYRNCVNASGFAQAGDTGQTFGGLFFQLVTGGSVPDVAYITDVLVVGGSNDRSHTATDIENEISAFCNTVRTYCPKAKIHIGFCGWTCLFGNAGIADHLAFNAAEEAYRTCQKYGASFIKGLQNCAKDYDNFYNVGHMNTTGMAAIADYLTSYLVGGSATYVTERDDVSYTINSAIFSSSDLKIKQRREDDQTILHVYADTLGPLRGMITVDVTGGSPVPAGQFWGNILDFDGGLIASGVAADAQNDFSADVGVVFQTYIGGVYKNDLNMVCHAFIQNSSLYLEFFPNQDDATKWANITQMYLFPFDIIIPTRAC